MSTTKDAKMTEAEFLDAQAEEARAAVQQTWAELKETLKETASLEVWAKRHPWLVAGTAVAGGFLIATAMFSPHAPAEPVGDEKRETSDSRRLAWLVGPLFDLLRPVFGQILSSLLSAALGALTGAVAAEAADEKVAASGEDAAPF
ncbi:MAG TPA: hypothetical protein VF278_14010 [Pirellulales bacterium]